MTPHGQQFQEQTVEEDFHSLGQPLIPFEPALALGEEGNVTNGTMQCPQCERHLCGYTLVVTRWAIQGELGPTKRL